VFGHRADGLDAQPLPCKPFTYATPRRLAITTSWPKVALRATPPWLGREVDLRVQRQPDADGEVLAADGVGEALDQFRVVQRTEAQHLRPL